MGLRQALATTTGLAHPRHQSHQTQSGKKMDAFLEKEVSWTGLG